MIRWDTYVQEHGNELRREADMARLVKLAAINREQLPVARRAGEKLFRLGWRMMAQRQTAQQDCQRMVLQSGHVATLCGGSAA